MEAGHELCWWETGVVCERRYHVGEQWYNFRPDALAEYRIGQQHLRFWLVWDRGTINVRDLSIKCSLYAHFIASREWAREDVRGKGGKERLMPLGPTCFNHLHAYLKQMEPTTKRGLTSRKAGGDPLFGSKGKQPLTRNRVTMVFARFRQQAGISEEAITPQVLRHSFALRYLQAGGTSQGLHELMGYEGMAPIRQYLRWLDQLLHEKMQKGTEKV